jgi:hypothetical protein
MSEMVTKYPTLVSHWSMNNILVSYHFELCPNKEFIRNPKTCYGKTGFIIVNSWYNQNKIQVQSIFGVLNLQVVLYSILIYSSAP